MSGVRLRTPLRRVLERAARERRYLRDEIARVRGLMPILMKRRNGQRWTAEDRVQLREHLERLSTLTPYLVVLAMPGGFAVLPVLAWWLERRRNRRAALSADQRSGQP